MNFLLVSILIIAICQSNSAPNIPGLTGPLHASCQIKWTWALDCPSVQKAIVNQINTYVIIKKLYLNKNRIYFKTDGIQKITAKTEVKNVYTL